MVLLRIGKSHRGPGINPLAPRDPADRAPGPGSPRAADSYACALALGRVIIVIADSTLPLMTLCHCAVCSRSNELGARYS